jgi:hypothetical protein
MSRLADAIIRRVTRRPPDFVVGGHDNPYLRRWWVIPRNPLFNIYLHQFLRDDDDRALHDHPWAWCSILLKGCYIEHTIAAGGIHHQQVRGALSIKISGPRRAHRIELLKGAFNLGDGYRSPDFSVPCWTLFITGPRMRKWGFHCSRGWVPWERFTASNDRGSIGAGCGDAVTVPKPLPKGPTHG